jgi:type I restriction enzyme R subunit
MTNTRESGLESLIVDWLVAHNGFEQGVSADYNREYAVDETRLFRFLETTQPKQMAQLGLLSAPSYGYGECVAENTSPFGEPPQSLKRTQFLDRLRGEIAKRGRLPKYRVW